MSTTLRSEFFGPYKLVRKLDQALGATRFIVLCSRTDTNYVLYRFAPTTNHIKRRSKFNHLLKLTTLDHSHILSLKSVTYDDHGRLCVITPYTGNHDGLVSLNDLIAQRNGEIGIIESARAIEHLLDATKYAHSKDLYHGTIDQSDILIDRYGCLQIQFYGFDRNKQNNDHSPIKQAIKVADEVRSIVQVGYFMLTGINPSIDRIPPSRIIKKLDKAWDAWFEMGLDPIDGFESIEHAINALPTNQSCNKYLARNTSARPQVHIGSMLRRFRTPTSQTTR